VARIWENKLPGGSGREVVTDAGEVTTDGVGGMVIGVGAVELGRRVERGDSDFTAAAGGPVDGEAAGPVVAPRAAPAIAPRVTNPIKR